MGKTYDLKSRYGMATERKWDAVPNQSILADGTTDGAISIQDSSLFKVKQKVYLKSDTLQPTLFEVKRVPNRTTLLVGFIKDPISKYADVSSYTLSDNSTIFAQEQDRNSVLHEAVDRATYEEEPTMARRVVQVDKSGVKIDSVIGSDGKNRIAVDAEVTVDNLQLLDKPYDSGTETYPSSTQEVVITFIGGLSGTPVQRVTLNYSDATKDSLTDFQRETWNGSSWVVG